MNELLCAERKKNKICIIIKLMRAKHYIKNIMIFIPIVFAAKFTNKIDIIRTIATFISFSFLASFIYIINDIIDVEKDRQHPIKKNRPIASKEISVNNAILISIILFIISFILAYFIDTKIIVINLIYLATNILYSFYLKNIPIIDVSIIALGFILRVMAGGSAISVTLSSWLLLTIMVLSFYLGFGKRRNEIIKTDSSIKTRSVLKAYSISFLDNAMNLMMTLSIVFYSLWVIDLNKVLNNIKLELFISIPMVIIGMLRYSLVIEGDSHADPTDVILSDRMLQIIIIVFTIYIISIYMR
ncbi:MAG: decaprenyl-phosphate phosphoribosyltransferase [Clostridium neonatale]